VVWIHLAEDASQMTCASSHCTGGRACGYDIRK